MSIVLQLSKPCCITCTHADMIPPHALQTHATQLLALAAFYQIDDLQVYVEDNLHIELNNASALLHAAKQHGSKEFNERVLQFVVGHGQELFNQQEFFNSLDGKTNQLVLLAAAGATAVGDKEDERKEVASSGEGGESKADK